MSIDNHAAWLGEAHFCDFCDFCGTLKNVWNLCAWYNISAGNQGCFCSRLPVFPVFFRIFRYEKCVRKQQKVPLKLTCDVLHL